MAQGVVVLDIYQPGDAADRLLVAVAAVLGIQTMPEPNIGENSVMIPVDDYERAWATIANALDTPDNDGQLIVRLISPQPAGLDPS